MTPDCALSVVVGRAEIPAKGPTLTSGTVGLIQGEYRHWRTVGNEDGVARSYERGLSRHTTRRQRSGSF